VAGEAWQLLVRLKRRNGFSNPGGFDYEAQLFRSGIGAVGYIRADERNKRVEAVSARYAILRARAWISERMQNAVEDRSMLGVMQGLAIGDTRQMTAEQWAVFAASGTTHLMAISGLHVSMVAVLAGWVGGGMVRRWRGAQARRLSAMHGQALAGSLGALGYALLAGFSVPTQRTLIMLCVYFGARWLRRELTVASALGLALVAVLLIDPFAPLAPGAWLSFAAVAVIALALAGRLVRDHAVLEFGRVQLAITIGLMPLLLAAFGSVSLASPLANTLAIPSFTLVIVPLTLAGALLAVVSTSLAGPVLALTTLLLEALWSVLQWLAAHPFALWYFPAPTLVSLAALAIGVVLLILPGIWPLRLLGALLCLQSFIAAGPRPGPGDFELAVLDVGQGLATMVRTHSHVLVYDTGPAFRSGRDAADLAVLPYLRSKGVARLDLLVVSHGDLDHRGGMHSILDALPTERTLVGPSIAKPPLGAIPCLEGQRWSWDGVQFEILHPSAIYSGSDNDTSCVLRIRGQGGSALLTGDIETAAEHELLQDELQRVDVIVAPHHGSRTSSSEGFVAATAPELVLFSSGYRNRWDLPKEDIVQRWEQVGARTFTTARSGAIEITFAPDAPLVVREHRQLSRRYWSR
jgi:competence protein ComEC